MLGPHVPHSLDDNAIPFFSAFSNHINLLKAPIQSWQLLYTHGPREMKAGINKSISPAAAKEEEGGYFEAD